MKKLTVISSLVLALGFSVATSTALAATNSHKAGTTQPYLYVYSIPGAGGAAGQVTATLKSYTDGSGSTVGLPGGLPYNGSAPIIVQNGKDSGPVSAELTYDVHLGTVASSECTVQVDSPNIGLPAAAPNGQAKIIKDSGGQGLCGILFNPVEALNSEDGDQVINLNWKMAL